MLVLLKGESQLIENKLDYFVATLEKTEIDLAVISHPLHLKYFLNIDVNPHERVALFFVSRTGEGILFVPELDLQLAQAGDWYGRVLTYSDNQNPWEIIAQDVLPYFKTTTLTLLGLETQHLSFERGNILQSLCPESKIVSIDQLLNDQKVLKSTTEIAKMVRAGALADIAFSVGFSFLKEGVSEQEVVTEIEYQLKKYGVKEMSFATIVLFGERSALPHGVPSNERRLQKNEPVLFDLGVYFDGYTSDASRTVFFGTPTELFEKVYDTVLTAQTEAQKYACKGIHASTLDKMARNIIADAGYNLYFTHRLGHGLGMSIHEYPDISENSDAILDVGMCFSIEPGIYLPEKFGVRIEDCVYIDEHGEAVSFTQTPKKLLSIT